MEGAIQNQVIRWQAIALQLTTLGWKSRMRDGSGGISLLVIARFAVPPAVIYATSTGPDSFAVDIVAPYTNYPPGKIGSRRAWRAAGE